MSFVRGIRNLFSGRIVGAAREFTGLADRERERERERPSPRVSERPSQRGPATAIGESEFFPAGAPQYDAGTNTWAGIDKTQWRQMQRLMDRQIREGANYNETLTTRTWATEDERRALKPRDRQRLYIDAYLPSQRYGYIIDVLEGGLITPEDMLRLLEESDRIAREYAQGDKRAGRRRWENRNRELPDELFFYHWGF